MRYVAKKHCSIEGRFVKKGQVAPVTEKNVKKYLDAGFIEEAPQEEPKEAVKETAKEAPADTGDGKTDAKGKGAK